MFPTRPGPDAGRSDRSTGVVRRTVLAGSAVALVGCSGLPLTGAPTYERGDIDLSFSVDCVDAEDGIVRAMLTWEWRGDGGSSRDDVAVIYWVNPKWELLDTAPTESVIFEEGPTTDRKQAIRFRHDDAAAGSDTSYAATAILAPTGDFDPEDRNVYWEFAHLSDADEGTDRDGRTGESDRDWYVAGSSQRAGLACRDGDP